MACAGAAPVQLVDASGHPTQAQMSWESQRIIAVVGSFHAGKSTVASALVDAAGMASCEFEPGHLTDPHTRGIWACTDGNVTILDTEGFQSTGSVAADGKLFAMAVAPAHAVVYVVPGVLTQAHLTSLEFLTRHAHMLLAQSNVTRSGTSRHKPNLIVVVNAFRLSLARFPNATAWLHDAVRRHSPGLEQLYRSLYCVTAPPRHVSTAAEQVWTYLQLQEQASSQSPVQNWDGDSWAALGHSLPSQRLPAFWDVFESNILKAASEAMHGCVRVQFEAVHAQFADDPPALSQAAFRARFEQHVRACVDQWYAAVRGLPHASTSAVNTSYFINTGMNWYHTAVLQHAVRLQDAMMRLAQRSVAACNVPCDPEAWRQHTLQVLNQRVEHAQHRWTAAFPFLDSTMKGMVAAVRDTVHAATTINDAAIRALQRKAQEAAEAAFLDAVQNLRGTSIDDAAVDAACKDAQAAAASAAANVTQHLTFHVPPLASQFQPLNCSIVRDTLIAAREAAQHKVLRDARKVFAGGAWTLEFPVPPAVLRTHLDRLLQDAVAAASSDAHKHLNVTPTMVRAHVEDVWTLVWGHNENAWNKVFDPAFQLVLEYARDHQGSGMGMMQERRVRAYAEQVVRSMMDSLGANADMVQFITDNMMERAEMQELLYTPWSSGYVWLFTGIVVVCVTAWCCARRDPYVS